MGFCRVTPARSGLFSSILISTFLAFLIVVSTFSSVWAFHGLWPSIDTWVSALPPAPAALTLELPRTECPDAFSGLKIDREKPLILNPFLLDPPQIRDRASGKSSFKISEETLTVYHSSVTTSYSFEAGQSGTEGRYGIDLLLPTERDRPSAFFFQAHSEFRDLYSGLSDSQDQRVDIAFGAGWRGTFKDSFMLGLSGFFDVARLDREWKWAPGFGMETAMRVLDKDCFLDLSLNFYRGGGVDAEVGYTMPIMDNRLDARIMVGKYRFFDYDYILGSKGGLAISTPDRTFTLSYEHGRDSRTTSYHAVSCQVAVSFRLEDLFAGKNPFVKPDPLNPRERRLINTVAQKVRRDWRHPDSVVAMRNTAQGEKWTTPGSLKLENVEDDCSCEKDQTICWERSIYCKDSGPDKQICPWWYPYWDAGWHGNIVWALLGTGLHAGYVSMFGPYEYDRGKKEE